jgi:hypothetical protein
MAVYCTPQSVSDDDGDDYDYHCRQLTTEAKIGLRWGLRRGCERGLSVVVHPHSRRSSQTQPVIDLATSCPERHCPQIRLQIRLARSLETVVGSTASHRRGVVGGGIVGVGVAVARGSRVGRHHKNPSWPRPLGTERRGVELFPVVIVFF